MRVGPYEVLPETAWSLALNAADSWRTIVLGWPRLAGGPEEIARASLRANARGVLWAGAGHFRWMWAADFGKALEGAWEALDAGYLGGQIELMTDESARRGRVTTCFRPGRGFDMPWPRGDGLPWLVFAHASRLRRTGRAPDAARLRALQALLDAYEDEQLEDGLVSPRVTGDWMDTVRRPSSTYNNLCVLLMLREAPALGLRTRHGADAFERRLLERRWRGTHFADCAGGELPSADAAVALLYLGLGPADVRARAADWLEASGLLDPLPMRCAAGHDDGQLPLLTRLASGYHRSVWLHLGLMALNGLAREGRDVSARLARVEAVIRRHGQIVEAVDGDGVPYRSLFLSCERGLSMAAGQYLELKARLAAGR